VIRTRNKPKSKENLNQQLTVRTAHIFVDITVQNCRTQYSTEQ